MPSARIESPEIPPAGTTQRLELASIPAGIALGSLVSVTIRGVVSGFQEPYTEDGSYSLQLKDTSVAFNRVTMEDALNQAVRTGGPLTEGINPGSRGSQPAGI